jgi:hypothetical protein
LTKTIFRVEANTLAEYLLSQSKLRLALIESKYGASQVLAKVPTESGSS